MIKCHKTMFLSICIRSSNDIHQIVLDDKVTSNGIDIHQIVLDDKAASNGMDDSSG